VNRVPKKGNVLSDVLSNVLLADELRDDYMFSHSFDAATRQFYKVKSGSLVIFISERYQTSFEPKWHTLEITVYNTVHISISSCLRCLYFSLF